MSSKKSKSKSKTNRVIELSSAKIGFIGAGRIAESIVQGLINYGKINQKQIFVAAPSDKNSIRMKELGCTTTKRNIDIFARYDCDIVFLCVHGGVIQNCYKMGGLRPHPLTVNYIPNMRHPLVILSLISGFDLSQIKAVLLNPEHPDKYILEMHRIMINSAC
ncbi:pyrroline-5-carboxylate reductase-like protein 1, partial [Dinothrombium tinctorium]